MTLRTNKISEVYYPSFTLAGLKLPGFTSNKDNQSAIDCGKLWERFMRDGIQGKIDDKVSDDIFAVYYNYKSNYLDDFEYFIGCKVHPDVLQPEGIQILQVPTGKYTHINAEGSIPECIGETWQEIWNSEIPRAYSFDFERYGPLSKDWNDGVVPIYISTH